MLRDRQKALDCSFFLSAFRKASSCTDKCGFVLCVLQAEVTSEQISSLLEATGNTEVEAFYPIIFANYLSDPEKIATLIASPGAGGGGGGGGTFARAGCFVGSIYLEYALTLTYSFFICRRRRC
jgi:hypothetical protein